MKKLESLSGIKLLEDFDENMNFKSLSDIKLLISIYCVVSIVYLVLYINI
jgi:hypothetical protein